VAASALGRRCSHVIVVGRCQPRCCSCGRCSTIGTRPSRRSRSMASGSGIAPAMRPDGRRCSAIAAALPTCRSTRRRHVRPTCRACRPLTSRRGAPRCSATRRRPRERNLGGGRQRRVAHLGGRLPRVPDDSADSGGIADSRAGARVLGAARVGAVTRVRWVMASPAACARSSLGGARGQVGLPDRCSDTMSRDGAVNHRPTTASSVGPSMIVSRFNVDL